MASVEESVSTNKHKRDGQRELQKETGREPNVGPEPAQILRISGFVNSKTDRKNATVLSGFSCDLKKKKNK